MGANQKASAIAFGGIMAALAVTVMAMGTIIPVATYVCPVICMLILQMVLKTCGKRIAWSWYGAVALLSLLLAPDKESAIVFSFIGYYPILKPWMDRKKAALFLKALYFNTAILTAYFLMLKLLGLEQVIEDLSGSGMFVTAALLIMGNATFFLVDKLLGMEFRRIKR